MNLGHDEEWKNAGTKSIVSVSRGGIAISLQERNCQSAIGVKVASNLQLQHLWNNAGAMLFTAAHPAMGTEGVQRDAAPLLPGVGVCGALFWGSVLGCTEA